MEIHDISRSWGNFCAWQWNFMKNQRIWDYLTLLMKVFSIQYLWMIYVNGNMIPGDRHTFQEKAKCLLPAYCKVVLFISCRTAYVISMFLWSNDIMIHEVL